MTWQTTINERWNYGREMTDQFSLTMRLPCHCRVLLHTAELRHRTDGFTSPPKEACWGFFRPKNPTASAGFEPANLVTRGHHAKTRPPKPLWAPAYSKLEQRQMLSCLTSHAKRSDYSEARCQIKYCSCVWTSYPVLQSCRFEACFARTMNL
jgi:hypothetical protein